MDFKILSVAITNMQLILPVLSFLKTTRDKSGLSLESFWETDCEYNKTQEDELIKNSTKATLPISKNLGGVG